MRWYLLLFALLSLLTSRLYDRFLVCSLRVTFLDVGQGDSTLVRFPGGTTMLIDAGGGFGQFNLGQRELFLELARMGILTLDYAVLSHPDLDHGYGFLGLFDNLSIKRFIYNRSFLSDAEPRKLLLDLLKLAQSKGTIVEAREQESYTSQGGVSLRWLPPQLKTAETNDRSLVLQMSYSGHSFLFTGDMEAEAEEWLSGVINEPVTVLKVAHHGSKTSSTDRLLGKIRPRFSVISAGAQNRYGHPNFLALGRLKYFSKEVLRTDFHGFVEIEVDRKGKLRCRTSIGDCGGLN